MNTKSALRYVPILFVALFVTLGVVLIAFIFAPSSLLQGAAACEREGARKMQCFGELIERTLLNEGLPQAFDALAYLFARDGEFREGCHGNVHELGAAAYQRYQTAGSVELTPKTSYCGYGFFHGFMEALIAAKGD